MNVFLKRGQTLELKGLEAIIGKHLYLVPSETVCQQLSFVWGAFIFPTVGSNGAETMRGESLFSHIKVGKKVAWESDSSTCGSPRTSLSKAKNSHSCRNLSVPWLSGKRWCAGCPRCSPHEPHFRHQIHRTTLIWGEILKRVLSLFSKCLDCLFNVHLMLGIDFLIVLKISRSEQFESNLFHVRERLILSFH